VQSLEIVKKLTSGISLRIVIQKAGPKTGTVQPQGFECRKPMLRSSSIFPRKNSGALVAVGRELRPLVFSAHHGKSQPLQFQREINRLNRDG